MARNVSLQRGYPPRYDGPKGIIPEEGHFARTIAQRVNDREGINWGIHTQLRPPAYPNRFTREDYFRLATVEYFKETERTRVPLRDLPEDEDLTRGEKALARRIRARVLDGKDFDWRDFLGNVGLNFPNALSKRQLLVLASELSIRPARPAEEQPAQPQPESSSGPYFSAQQ